MRNRPHRHKVLPLSGSSYWKSGAMALLLVLTAPAAFAQDVAVKCRFGVGVTDGENGIESQAAKPDITFILHIRSDSGVVTAEGSRCARLNGTVVGTRVQLR